MAERHEIVIVTEGGERIGPDATGTNPRIEKRIRKEDTVAWQEEQAAKLRKKNAVEAARTSARLKREAKVDQREADSAQKKLDREEHKRIKRHNKNVIDTIKQNERDRKAAAIDQVRMEKARLAVARQERQIQRDFINDFFGAIGHSRAGYRINRGLDFLNNILGKKGNQQTDDTPADQLAGRGRRAADIVKETIKSATTSSVSKEAVKETVKQVVKETTKTPSKEATKAVNRPGGGVSDRMIETGFSPGSTRYKEAVVEQVNAGTPKWVPKASVFADLAKRAWKDEENSDNPDWYLGRAKSRVAIDKMVNDQLVGARSGKRKHFGRRVGADPALGRGAEFAEHRRARRTLGADAAKGRTVKSTPTAAKTATRASGAPGAQTTAKGARTSKHFGKAVAASFIGGAAGKTIKTGIAAGGVKLAALATAATATAAATAITGVITVGVVAFVGGLIYASIAAKKMGDTLASAGVVSKDTFARLNNDLAMLSLNFKRSERFGSELAELTNLRGRRERATAGMSDNITELFLPTIIDISENLTMILELIKKTTDLVPTKELGDLMSWALAIASASWNPIGLMEKIREAVHGIEKNTRKDSQFSSDVLSKLNDTFGLVKLGPDDKVTGFNVPTDFGSGF